MRVHVLVLQFIKKVSFCSDLADTSESTQTRWAPPWSCGGSPEAHRASGLSPPAHLPECHPLPKRVETRRPKVSPLPEESGPRSYSTASAQRCARAVRPRTTPR